VILIFFYCTCSCELFGFSSKAEAQRLVAGQVIPVLMKALYLVSVPPARKGERGAKAPWKIGT
jgi:hypothetical protein